MKRGKKERNVVKNSEEKDDFSKINWVIEKRKKITISLT